MQEIVSIDIETSGRDPMRHQILEVAFVPLNSALPTFHEIIKWQELRGEPEALLMNMNLIRRIRDGEGAYLGDTVKRINTYLRDLKNRFGRLVALGKNVSSFDLVFLKQAKVNIEDNFYVRTIDPGVLFMHADETLPPTLSECAERAGIKVDKEELHGALYDAELTLRIYEAGRKRTNA